MRLHIQTNHRQKYPRRRAARSSARFGRLFPHAADSGGLSLPWLRVWSADAHQGLFVSLPDVHGNDNFRRLAGICHRVDAAFNLRAAGDVSDGAADLDAPPVLWAVSAGQVCRGWPEEAAAHLWPVRRNLLHHLLRRRAAGGDRGWCYLWVTVLDWCYWGAGAAVLLHIWRRQMLLSIAGGTIVYMLLVQMM